MINKGSTCLIIRGLCPQLVPGGVVSLQYSDDTLIFLEKDERNAINLKWTLTCFEQISGMKINYHKSELMAINMEQGEMQPFFGYFPMCSWFLFYEISRYPFAF
jgi:hypothetical protein